MNSRNYYSEISTAIEAYEYHKYHTKTIDWICQRIDWCWKWRKITEAQKNELCDRIIRVMNDEVVCP